MSDTYPLYLMLIKTILGDSRMDRLTNEGCWKNYCSQLERFFFNPGLGQNFRTDSSEWNI